MAATKAMKATPVVVEAAKALRPPAPLVGASPAFIQHQKLMTMQDELLERSLRVVDASMRFAEVSASDSGPPAAWVDELGEVGAQIRFRIAQASWMAAKDAPVGIKVASQVAVGIIKAKATEKAGPKQLNIAVAVLSAPLPQFVEQDMEER